MDNDWMERCIIGWPYLRIDGYVDKWMDGQMDVWMGG